MTSKKTNKIKIQLKKQEGNKNGKDKIKENGC